TAYDGLTEARDERDIAPVGARPCELGQRRLGAAPPDTGARFGVSEAHEVVPLQKSGLVCGIDACDPDFGHSMSRPRRPRVFKPAVPRALTAIAGPGRGPSPVRRRDRGGPDRWGPLRRGGRVWAGGTRCGCRVWSSPDGRGRRRDRT